MTARRFVCGPLFCDELLAMKRILIQLDTDERPSSFDRVVAVDAGVDELFSYGGITAENVEGLIHGAIFTRGPKDLHNTAVFVGGSDTGSGESVMAKVQKTFFGPMRVSSMMDSNGCNTTAAAAVLAAARHVDLSTSSATVFGGTGPVGQRAAQLLAAEGSRVRLVSRSADRASDVCDRVRSTLSSGSVEAVGASGEVELLAATEGCDVLIAAGAAGVHFLSEQALADTSLKVAIDLNAVPPAGLDGIGVTDKASDVGGTICYGAIGVGGTKMKIHKAAIEKLFAQNDLVLDTAAIFELGQKLEG